MENIKAFDYNNKQVRTVVIEDQIWWVLKDVCDILETVNPTMVANRLDVDEVTKFNLGGLSGESNIINESGLYKVILRSDKPQAKPFTNWVTKEVLPSIRRNGMYGISVATARTDIGEIASLMKAWMSMLSKSDIPYALGIPEMVKFMQGLGIPISDGIIGLQKPQGTQLAFDFLNQIDGGM